MCVYICIYIHIHGGTDCIIKGNLDELFLQGIKIYTRTLTIVLCGCENLSLTLKVEYSMRVSDKRVLSRIFEPMRDEVTGELRKLHNEGFHNLY
jgi:hypothetical protein